MRNNPTPVVTVKLDSTHSVSLNIPIEIIKGFILPFATALNFTTIPTLNTQSSQTTYMSNFKRIRPNHSEMMRNYTPLILESNSTEYQGGIDQTTSFEAQILKKMHSDILNMSIDSNTSERDSRNTSSSSSYDKYQSIDADKSLCDFSFYSPKSEGESKNNLNEGKNGHILDADHIILISDDSDSEECSIQSSSYIDFKEDLPFYNIDNIELDFFFKGRFSYSSNFPEQRCRSDTPLLQNIIPRLSLQEKSIEEDLEKVLEDIEGLIINLPATASVISTDHIEKPTAALGEVQRVLWRISENSNEDKQSTITENSDVASEQIDIHNDTFIVDDATEDMFNTFNVDEENSNVDSGQKEFLGDEVVMDTIEDNHNNHQDNVEDAGKSSEDEGIEDMTPQRFEKSSCNNEPITNDERVKKLSNVVYEYLQQQCFEIREIVLFPEVLHDPNLNKVLAKLKSMYDEFYPEELKSEEKNELRFSISAYILSCLEVDENINNVSNDSSILSILSDKIFSITEFVSDVLDNFFNLINCLVVKEDSNGENFLEFTKPFRDTNGNMLHSTPESPLNISENNTNEATASEVITPQKPIDVTAVTSFKKNTSKKSGAETFWISCYSSPRDLQDIERIPRSFVNVDEIPLRPPEDLINVSSSDKSLYSIKEEPRCNLFKNYEDETASDDLRSPYISETVVEDVLAGGDGSYLRFDNAEVNVVLHNEVQFYRISSIDNISYVKTDSIILQKSDESSDSFYSIGKCSVGSEDEGDWMGYEMAKF